MDPAIFAFFAELRQQGPGRDEETEAVLAGIAEALPERPAVADLGCGTGRTTLILAEQLPDATVTAVDLAPAFCARLARSVAARALSDRVRVVQADMAEPPFELGSLDLIWCEGAVYIPGFARALARWRPLVKPGGFCVVSECEWLTDARPEPVARFWAEAYPAMATRAQNVADAVSAGFEVLRTRTLSPQAWAAYYDPITRAIADGRTIHLGPDFAASHHTETAVFEASGGSYGYVFYVMRPAATRR